MKHIVIPYRHSPYEELRYALRSIEKNCNFAFDVTIIGEKPQWAKNINHVPYDDSAHKRYENLFNKIHIAMDMFEEFIWWHDDEFLLKPQSFEDLKKVYYLQDLKKVKKFGNRWFQQQLKFFKEEMEKMGLPAYNYCSHTPFYFNSKELKETFEFFKIDKEVTFVENYHFNRLGKHDEAILVYDVKVGKYDKSPFNPKDAEDKIFANFDEEGLKSGIFDWIKTQFPQKSSFEK